MKLSKLFTFFTILACLAGGYRFTLRAAAAEPPDPGQRGNLRARIAERLELTNDQKQQIQTFLGTKKERFSDLARKLHDARQTLRETINRDDATEAKVRAAAAKVAAVEADLAVERFLFLAKVRPILTPEQRDQVKALEEKADTLFDTAIRRMGERVGK